MTGGLVTADQDEQRSPARSIRRRARLPSISACTSVLTRSSPGLARRSAITPSWNSRKAMPASMAFSCTSGVGVPVVPRIRSSDHVSRSSYDDGGKPSRSAMISSGQRSGDVPHEVAVAAFAHLVDDLGADRQHPLLRARQSASG